MFSWQFVCVQVGSFDEGGSQFYSAEIILALEYLHNLGIIHRYCRKEWYNSCMHLSSQYNAVHILLLLAIVDVLVRVAEQSKTLHSGCSPLMWAWVRIPPMDTIQLVFLIFLKIGWKLVISQFTGRFLMEGQLSSHFYEFDFCELRRSVWNVKCNGKM